MKDLNINFPEAVLALGRNGNLNQYGLELVPMANVVEFVPIRKNGEWGRCFLQLPINQIDELITKLQEVKDNYI